MASCICNPELLPSIPSGTGDKGRGRAQGVGDSCHPRAWGSMRVQREQMKDDGVDGQNQGIGRVLVPS